MNNLTVLEQAHTLKCIQSWLIQLSLEELSQTYAEMREQVSFRESAMVLNPNPFTAVQQSDLEKLKVKQLGLYVDLRKNLEAIKKAEEALSAAKGNQNDLSKLFGL